MTEALGYRLDHVACGVHDLRTVPDLLVGTFGALPHDGGPGLGFTAGQWSFAGGGLLEVLEPAGAPGGFLHRFLERRGPGVHHVTFKVPDLASAAERARQRGYEIQGYNDSHPGWKECFLHPREAQGIVVQLAQTISARGVWGAEWDFPEPSGDVVAPAEPAALLGVRLAARTTDGANALWAGVLGGALEEHSPEAPLVFRWPESPLRIAVEIDPRAEEGPRCLEFVSAAPLELHEAPHPVLGVVLRVLTS